MIGFYFSRFDRRLRYGDGRRIKTGVTHKVDCAPVVCAAGLHASSTILDALGHAPGSVLWIVELGGEIVQGIDKYAATERTYLAGMDASKMLREFARQQALINVDCIKDKRVKKWLEGDVSRSPKDIRCMLRRRYGIGEREIYAIQAVEQLTLLADTFGHYAHNTYRWATQSTMFKNTHERNWFARHQETRNKAEAMLVDMLPKRMKDILKSRKKIWAHPSVAETSYPGVHAGPTIATTCYKE